MSQDIFYYSIMLLSPPLCCQILYVSALWTPMFHMEFPYILKICFISKPPSYTDHIHKESCLGYPKQPAL